MKKLLILLLFIPVFCFSQSNRLIKQFDEIKNNKSFLLKTDVYEANYSNIILNKSLSGILSLADQSGYIVTVNSSEGGIIFSTDQGKMIQLFKKVSCYKCTDAPRYSIGGITKQIHFIGNSIEDGVVSKITTEMFFGNAPNHPYWPDYFKLIKNFIENKFYENHNLDKSYKEYGIKALSNRDEIEFYDIVDAKEISKKNDPSSKLKITSSTKVQSKRSNSGSNLTYHYLRLSVESITLENIKNDIIENEISKNQNLNSLRFTIGGVDLRDINEYDLESMVKYFLDDCEKNNVKVPSINTLDATFVPQEEGVIALAYGYNNDDIIKIQIDPEKWAKSSSQKRWYVLYHELGHDILNLDHGQGGKMMFNFVDRDYTWDEFFEDKQYMLNFMKR
tara:strand:- start:443 stop:1615 length:1173 start_codon:yes stop_codon:yes gene_type:complete